MVSCADQSPVADATARLYLSEDDRRETRSGADGAFSVGLNHPHSEEEATLTVSAPGYQPAEQRVRSEQQVSICLEPASPGTASP